MSSISSCIFQELYEIYPKSITLRSLAKNLDLREKTVKSTINKAITEEVPADPAPRNAPSGLGCEVHDHLPQLRVGAGVGARDLWKVQACASGGPELATGRGQHHLGPPSVEEDRGAHEAVPVEQGRARFESRGQEDCESVQQSSAHARSFWILVVRGLVQVRGCREGWTTSYSDY